MSRYFYSRYSLVSIIFLFFVATIIISLNFKKALAETSVTENFVITSGTDSTTGSVTAFNLSEVSNLNLNDNNRVGSNSAWPVIASGSYDENKYLEFVFSPNVPSNATISSVKITHKYNRSGFLADAKLEIWDGVGSSNSVSVTLEGAYQFGEKINNTSIYPDDRISDGGWRKRQAYAAQLVSLYNLTDLVAAFDRVKKLEPSLKVTYTLPESTTPTPIPDSSPTPSLTPTPTPSSSPTPTPISTPDPDDVSAITLTNVAITKSSAVADNNYDHGWKWVLDLTIPKTEDELFVKFGDWTSETSTISAVSNMRMYSTQSIINSESNAVVVASVSAFSDGLLLTSDLDATKLGRQIQLNVEVKIPLGTIGGGYSTTYDFESR